ncbi:MAG: GIDE domain-containing protein [Kofleriaceae bacterium]
MSDGLIFLTVLGVIIAFIVVCALAVVTRGQRIKRALRATPRFAIAELPEDAPGRAVGAARPTGEPLRAPLSGRPCIYYVAVVEELHGKQWKETVREERGVPFVLDDGSGRALVDPTGAEVELDIDTTGASGTLDDASPAEPALLARHGRVSRGKLFNHSVKYREAIIAIGETVAVLGCAVREPDPGVPPTGEGYRQGPATRVRLTGAGKFPLRISDAATTTA